jgi:DNA invertase Pin-like site-specific DNA recombinase
MALKERSRNQYNQLSKEQAADVRARYAAGETQQAIADDLGVSQNYVSMIVRNRIIHLLPDDAAMPPPTRSHHRPTPRPSRRPHRKRKLTEEQVQQIRSLAGAISRDRIAKAFDVHKSTITHIVTGKQWRDA